MRMNPRAHSVEEFEKRMDRQRKGKDLPTDPETCFWRPCMTMDCVQYGPPCRHRDELITEQKNNERMMNERDTILVSCLIDLVNSDEEINGGDLIDVLNWILVEHATDYGVDIRGMFAHYGLLRSKEDV